MKYCFTLVYLLFCATYVFAQNVESDLPSNLIQLKILALNSIGEEKIYKITTKRDQKTDSVLIIHEIYKHDKNGDFVENREYFDHKKKTVLNINYHFGLGGKLSKLMLNADEKSFENREYAYDTAGNLITTTIYDKDTSYVEVYQRSFDSKGHCVKILEKRDQRPSRLGLAFVFPFRLKDSLFYSENGQLSEDRRYDGKGDHDKSYFYDYSGIDEKTIKVFEQEGNNQQVVAVDHYNKAGLLLSSMLSPFVNPFYDSTIDNTTWKYYYNPDGTLNTMIEYYDGKTKGSFKYYYTKL